MKKIKVRFSEAQFNFWLQLCFFIVNFEHISHLLLVFLLLTLNIKLPTGWRRFRRALTPNHVLCGRQLHFNNYNDSVEDGVFDAHK